MIKKALNIILIIAFSLNSGIIFAGEPLSLNLLIDEARLKNPDILAAKKRWEASLARVPQAKSLENPSIGFTFEKIRRGTLKLDRTMAEDRMLSVQQMLPWFGKLPLKGKIALVESQMAASEYKAEELAVINELKASYYDLFIHHKKVELEQESLIFLETIAKIAESKYIVGEASQGELFKINAEIAGLVNEIKNHEAEKRAHETHLNTLLNKSPEFSLGHPALLEDSVSFNKDINTLYRLTLENQPELLVFSYAIEKNKYAKDLAKKSFFPDLMAGIVQRGITSGTIGPWDLMLAFSVPLWFWTKQRYEVKEAIANLEEAKASYEAMKNKALFETKDLYTKIEIAQNKIKLYKYTQIPLLESSIQSSLAGYKSGKAEIMMLLDSERMLLETKMQYYQALVDYYMNLADLERAVGIELSEVKK